MTRSEVADRLVNADRWPDPFNTEKKISRGVLPLLVATLISCSDPSPPDPARSDPGRPDPEPQGSSSEAARSGPSGLAAALLEARSGADASLVCLGEVHGSTADADLRTALVARPAFADHFGHVLFEGASAAHQDLLDRYVVHGQEIASAELERVWRDAGRGLQWRLPIYRRLFDELRALNQGLPDERRVRLLGGAPPIPWDTMGSPEDLAPWIDREGWVHQRMLALVGKERATLAIYGRHHCERLRFEATDLGEVVLSVLSIGPTEDAEFRRRLEVAGTAPELLAVDALLERVLVRGTWGEGHLYRGSRFGEVADRVVSYGDVGHEVLVMREEDLESDERDELRRRDEWMAIAFASATSGTES